MKTGCRVRIWSYCIASRGKNGAAMKRDCRKAVLLLHPWPSLCKLTSATFVLSSGANLRDRKGLFQAFKFKLKNFQGQTLNSQKTASDWPSCRCPEPISGFQLKLTSWRGRDPLGKMPPHLLLVQKGHSKASLFFCLQQNCLLKTTNSFTLNHR